MGEGEAPPAGAPGISDRYYQGTIVRLYPGSRRGVVRSAGGREIPFKVPFVTIVGGRGFDDLREGMTVGFDVSWTSRGLRVSLLRLPDAAGPAPEAGTAR